MNDLDFKKKYIKYKLKYLQLKQKKQSGGMIEPLEVISDLVDRIDQELQVDEKQIEQIEKGVLESPLPASSLKRIQISFSSSNYFLYTPKTLFTFISLSLIFSRIVSLLSFIDPSKKSI